MSSPAVQLSLPRARTLSRASSCKCFWAWCTPWLGISRAAGARHGWSNADTVAPYRYSILVLALAMILGGLWQDRVGPRLVASVGGVLLGVGWLLSA